MFDHKLYPEDIPEDVRRRWWPEGFEESMSYLLASIDGFPEIPATDADTAALLDKGRQLGRSERRALEDDVARHASELGVALVKDGRGPAFAIFTGECHIPALTSDTRYAATMHELGHAATITPTSQRQGSVVHLEALAWEWALPRLKVHLSPEGEAASRDAFLSYREVAKGRADVRELETVGARFARF